MTALQAAASLFGPSLLSTALLGTSLAGPVRAQDHARDLRVTPEVLVVRQAKPSVVSVEVAWSVAPSSTWYQGSMMPMVQDSQARVFASMGSGLVIDEGGYIVTNFHVVETATLRSDARIRVQFDADQDQQGYPAQLVSWVREEDLALIKIDAPGPFPVATLGTSSDLMLAERVVSIGCPYGNRHSVNIGIISGLHRELRTDVGGGTFYSDLIQTDTPTNPGSSGGPLLNVLGEVIGITAAAKLGADGLGYAIPIDRVKRVLREQLFATSAAFAWFGFEVLERGSQQDLFVSNVWRDGPASAAGLQAGNQIVAVNGVPVAGEDSFKLEWMPLQPGEPVSLDVLCSGIEESIVMRGWNRHMGTLYERLGFTVHSVRSSFGLPLLRVDLVRPGSNAERTGIRRWDILDALQLEGREEAWRLSSSGDLARFVEPLERGTTLRFDLRRDDDRDGSFEADETYRGTLRVD